MKTAIVFLGVAAALTAAQNFYWNFIGSDQQPSHQWDDAAQVSQQH